jgi:hypothetical protein
LKVEKEKLKEGIEQIITDGVIECEEIDLTTDKVIKLIWPIIDYLQIPKSETKTGDQNSMAQANANYDRWKDARDVDKAYEEFLARLDPTNTPYWVEWAEKRTKAFAKFYAQRCGVEVEK